MQHYKVLARVKKIELPGLGDDVWEMVEYQEVYSESPESAIKSVCLQKNIKIEDIVGLKYELYY